MENLVTWRAGVRPKFHGRRVLVTGDTGFKGSWLCEWLLDLGAEVTGFALPPEKPSHFELLALHDRINHIDGDLRDASAVHEVFEATQPAYVFHLGAQALVRDSYADPAGTFATNVLGTAHVLDGIRRSSSVRAAVIVTSDKCYENNEWVWAYRENDRLGGHDPYSASKGAAELVVTSFQRSFFGALRPTLGLASARAGNVIGGGDWARDRLVPDCARTLLEGRKLRLRNPDAVRPWQHVLEPLSGYLRLATALERDPVRLSGAFNFGPESNAAVTVETVARRFHADMQTGEIVVEREPNGVHEARLLRLSCEKAQVELGHRPVLATDEAIGWTSNWYRAFRDSPETARALTLKQLREFEARLCRTEAES